jgi:hypothetical protein
MFDVNLVVINKVHQVFYNAYRNRLTDDELIFWFNVFRFDNQRKREVFSAFAFPRFFALSATGALRNGVNDLSCLRFAFFYQGLCVVVGRV